MNRRTAATTVFAALALGSVLTLLVQRVRAAGIPETGTLTYSGYLTTADGEPVNGAMSIAVMVYPAAEGGDLVCEAGGVRVEVEDGRFQVPLSDACTTAVKASPELWVEVNVAGAPVARTKLGAVPYAVEAAHAEHAAYADIAGSATRAGESVALAADAFFTTTDCAFAEGRTDCVCPEDAAVVSGGACSSFECVDETGVTLAGRPLDRRTYRIECKNSAGSTVECTNAYAMCVRVTD